MDVQGQLDALREARNTHTEEGFNTIATMHKTYVSRTCALAPEAQLRGLLESQDFHHQFRLSEELQPVDACCSASQSQQCHSSL